MVSNADCDGGYLIMQKSVYSKGMERSVQRPVDNLLEEEDGELVCKT